MLYYISKKNPKLTIITPSNREYNLSKLCKYIKKYNIKYFDVTWFIVFDYPPTHNLSNTTKDMLKKETFIKHIFFYNESNSGTAQINKAIDNIDDDSYVCFMPDDNKPHPKFFKRMAFYMRKHPKKAYCLGQKHRWIGDLVAKPENMREGFVDGGQVVIRRSLIGDRRLPTSHPAPDGYFIESIHKEHPRDFYFIDEILCYYEHGYKIKLL